MIDTVEAGKKGVHSTISSLRTFLSIFMQVLFGKMTAYCLAMKTKCVEVSLQTIVCHWSQKNGWLKD